MTTEVQIVITTNAETPHDPKEVEQRIRDLLQGTFVLGYLRGQGINLIALSVEVELRR